MKRILVGHKLVDKCEKYAAKLEKSAHKKRELYCKGRISPEKRQNMNYVGAVAECAMCIELGLDPYTALNWNDRPDDGYDIETLSGMTIDVKASDHPGARRLIWPVTKMDKLFGAADIFVFARVPATAREPLGQVVNLVGWTTKQRFISVHTKAQNISGLKDDTPFMDEKDLDDMELLMQHIQHISATA